MVSTHPAPMGASSGSERLASLDPAVLDENTMRDLALQKELFGLYFGQSSVYLATMAEALNGGDRVAWSAAAHGLKGTARTLGFLRLAAATAAAERVAPSHQLISEVEDAVLDARAAAAAYLARVAQAA